METYETDTIDNQQDHQVVCLSCYYCHYSPIKLIWTQVKSYDVEKNPFKRLTHTKTNVANLSSEERKNCVRYTEML